MSRPTIREFVRSVEDDERDERDDSCRVKLGAHSECLRGQARCVAHHSEMWMDWTSCGDTDTAVRDGVTAVVVDSEERTVWLVIGPDGVRARGQATTLREAQFDAERRAFDVRESTRGSESIYLRALAAAYRAAEPLCPANEDGTGEWCIDDVAPAVAELRERLEAVRVALGASLDESPEFVARSLREELEHYTGEWAVASHRIDQLMSDVDVVKRLAHRLVQDRDKWRRRAQSAAPERDKA